MKHKKSALRRARWTSVCLAAGLLLAALLTWSQKREPWLASYWENELERAGSARAEGILQRLVALGKPGLAAVVRGLGQSRERIGEMAYLTLDDEIERAGYRPSRQAHALLADLAEALADNVERLPPAAHGRVAKLAMKILLSPPADGLFDRGRLLAACDRTLRAAQHGQALAANAKADSNQPHRADTPASAVPAKPRILPPDHSMVLELAELAPPELPRADRAVGEAGEPPRILGAFDGAALVATHHRPADKSQGNGGDVATVGYTRAETDRRRQAQEARDELRATDTLKLFALLNESGETAAAAAIELEARGYSSRQIEVGRHLTSPDASERLRWAELLPGIRGIDARFWLLRLSDDVNLQVRRTAVGLLATDPDPEVMRRLRRTVIEESDDEIRNQAARALEVWESPGER
ncbi:MAG: hypothetical protein B7Z73_07150 [Planctomycetia bacterium 21-64-5]|nr:MAG: hypothetical protein B7Z73_07150 [Planctomycetia bacterium 21-64-5]HQU42976.1 hypothetical protein [Pirellulales bacterium]